MIGQAPARGQETAPVLGLRADFVGSLGGRVEALRAALRAVEQQADDEALRNGVLRRVHALASSARVLGFESVADALSEAEKRLHRLEFGEVSRVFDLLPSLVLGVPLSLRPGAEPSDRGVPGRWPLSVLVFGAQALADAIKAIPHTHVECERTEDLARALEQAQSFGPDLAVIDADRAGARELLSVFARDPQVDPVPVVVIGDFSSPEAASAFIALGAARVLSKPVGLDTLQRTLVELRALGVEPRPTRDPLGELSVEALSERISGEIKRGLLDAVEPFARSTSVGFGEGTDVMAAVWGAVARVRELVTLRSGGVVRFDESGPEGGVPFAAWGAEERRAGDRAGDAGARSGDGVSLQGRRMVVADDDPAVLWFMSDLLKAMGVEVLEAHDGASALALTYDTWPDLVISDVLMPQLDGFSLCHEIKRDVAVRDTPVILLSWKEDLLQRVRELGGSADGYLRKEAAAATVAERLREVLRPRARIERRIAASADARGRLDGLTPRLILELVSASGRDVRVTIRDAVFVYEVQLRAGQLCAASRGAGDGSFERGEGALSALLGVSAGRFVVEPDTGPFVGDFAGTLAEMLKAPVERARRALHSVSAGALVGVTRVTIAPQSVDAYLVCTPEPARGLLQQVMGGASPRELITSGLVAPRLLEAVLSDAARRGAILGIERIGSEPPAPHESLAPPPSFPRQSSAPRHAPEVHEAPASVPEAKAPASAPEVHEAPASAPEANEAPARVPEVDEASARAPEVDEASARAPEVDEAPARAPGRSGVPAITEADATLFSFQLDPSTELPASLSTQQANVGVETVRVVDEHDRLPFSSEVTPAIDRLWETSTEGAFNEITTLKGVGDLPEVALVPPPAAPQASTPRAHAEPLETVETSDKSVDSDDRDALAEALTETTPAPLRSLHATQVMVALSVPATQSSVAIEERRSGDLAADDAHITLLSAGEPSGRSDVARRRTNTERKARSVDVVQISDSPSDSKVEARAGGARGWFIKMLIAFAVSYLLVSYFRTDVVRLLSGRAPGPQPASSR